MPSMPIVSMYAPFFAILFVILSVRTIRLRRKLRVAVGDQGNLEMLRAMRVHANFAEYVPLSLMLIYFVEINNGWSWMVHGLCILLVAGRLSHAYGVSQVRENFRFRVSGMMMTFSVLILSSIFLLIRPFL